MTNNVKNAEQELCLWLDREENTLLENFNFGIKAIRSAEFALSSKYDVLLNWFTNNVNKILTESSNENNEFECIENFLGLKYPIHLVRHTTCKLFIESILIFATEQEEKFNSRKFTEILFLLSKHEIIQNIDKKGYEIFTKLINCIFIHYQHYLKKKSKEKFLTISEKDFFDQVVGHIKEYIKGSKTYAFADYFHNYSLTNMINVVLILKENNLLYFNDVLEIHKSLFLNYDKYIFQTNEELPIYVCLVNFECGLINLQSNVIFYEKFIKTAFALAENRSNPKQGLLVLIYILELLKKYEVNLKFQINSELAIKYIGRKIEEIATSHVKKCLPEVMWLICSTIRLNPLILEYSISKLAVKIITIAKSTLDEIQMYEIFIITLLEMFKKLNRSEKYVANLLKALNNYLTENKISQEIEIECPKKKRKIEKPENFYTSDTEDILGQNLYYFEFLMKDLKNKNNDELRKATFNLVNIYNNNNTTSSLTVMTLGKQFSKFISNLVSKPSLVIWRTILFELQNLIGELKQHNNISDVNETILFKLEFTSDLLCQYFAGSKLVEHYDKFTFEIDNNLKSTKIILKDFGQFLLNIEHNNRIVNSFLEIVQNFGMFNFILFYYPSINETKEFSNVTKTIYDFLSSDEWILIEQRIANFGDFDTKYKLNVLSIQKLNGKIFSQHNKITDKINIKAILSSSTCSDPEQIIKIFTNKNNSWLIQHLFETEKNFICNIILNKISENELDIQYLKILINDNDCLKIIINNLYFYLGKIINSKKSILHNIDFHEYKTLKIHNKIEFIIGKIENNKNKTIKNIESEQIDKYLNIFNLFNVGSCKKEIKIEIFVLQLALYRDLLNTSNDILINKAYNILENLLYFEPSIEICNYISFELMIKIVPPLVSRKFYELLFQNLKKNNEKDTQKFLSDIVTHFKSSENINEEQIKLLLTLIETLAKMDNKKFTPIQHELLEKFEIHFFNFIKCDQNSKDDEKCFVEETITAFSVYLNYALQKIKNGKLDITDDFRKFCKIYIGYSVNTINKSSISLMVTALNNHQILHFDPDEIQLVLEKYWEQIKEDLEMKQEDNFENINNEKYNNIMKMIVDNSTNIKFRNLLLEIGKDINIKNIFFICRIIKQISKLTMNQIKCAILNEYFKKITSQILFTLEKDQNQQFINYDIIIILLNTMRSLCENRKIPLGIDHIDGILSFLMDINLKNFILSDSNEIIYKKLHEEMASICITLIKSRHEIISDRIPQFIIIYQELLQSLCWYKSERQKDVMLNDEDLQDLGDIAAKLENIMNLLVKHELNLKRIAPYLLTFVIGLMVSDKRSTTLYSKIKTHIESICYSLIKVCDHRVKPFILRCTNDATRHVYETLFKEYEKYHKFKGKV